MADGKQRQLDPAEQLQNDLFDKLDELLFDLECAHFNDRKELAKTLTLTMMQGELLMLMVERDVSLSADSHLHMLKAFLEGDNNWKEPSFETLITETLDFIGRKRVAKWLMGEKN